MQILYAYPILLTSCGIFIHAFGLFGVEYGSCPAWLHFIMLSIDSAVVIGLISKSSWGWRLSVALFIQQVVCQTYWLYQSGWLGTPFQLQIPVPLLCLAALIILIFNRNKFVQLQNGKNEVGI